MERGARGRELSLLPQTPCDNMGIIAYRLPPGVFVIGFPTGHTLSFRLRGRPSIKENYMADPTNAYCPICNHQLGKGAEMSTDLKEKIEILECHQCNLTLRYSTTRDGKQKREVIE